MYTLAIYTSESCLKFQLAKVLNDTDDSVLQMTENKTLVLVIINNFTRSFNIKCHLEIDVE